MGHIRLPSQLLYNHSWNGKRKNINWNKTWIHKILTLENGNKLWKRGSFKGISYNYVDQLHMEWSLLVWWKIVEIYIFIFILLLLIILYIYIYIHLYFEETDRIWVQIQNKYVCILNSANTLGKGMNPIILLPTMDK